MTGSQPLNYCSKAIEQFSHGGNPVVPISSAAIRYICDKLVHAEKFVLPEGGRLLPTDKEKPEVPGLVFRPPFPVVALEYEMRPGRHDQIESVYTTSVAPKRIALAWDWQNDFPPLMRSIYLDDLDPGVMVMEISWRQEVGMWLPGLACLHLAYEDAWSPMQEVPAFVQSMVERGQIAPKFARLNRNAFPHKIVPMMAEAIMEKARLAGSMAAAIDLIRHDTNDEMIAYIDLCYALACKNVSYERQSAPEKLNRSRIRNGKMPLFDHHMLLVGGESYGGNGHGVGADRDGPRSHLRRGHIRRLSPDRITWVNQTMVHGRGGFIEKTYRMKGAA